MLSAFYANGLQQNRSVLQSQDLLPRDFERSIRIQDKHYVQMLLRRCFMNCVRFENFKDILLTQISVAKARGCWLGQLDARVMSA